MVQASKNDILTIGKVLNDSARPLKERFRALFTLKNIGGAMAIDQIHACFKDSSVLLKHELAYCLGQMRDPAAISILTNVLEDLSQEPMVRHEAGEALGAIGESSVIPLLEKYCKDPIPEVAETCQLALNRLRWLECNSNAKDLQKNPYSTIDPAPPVEITDVKVLRDILLDESKSLFDRYRAMFSLRNLSTRESILALTEGLKTGSALFKHEVAFVLGQLQDEASVPGLQASLEDMEENEMVRHECAEALGSIATPECYEILNRYLNDSKKVVHESCVIALDMCDYENSTEFQYADTLTKLSTV
ncbi:PREDICTED: deoxyhypusine hydroxylase [Cyphomyrmex costatus]|uniref:Deoxyhypusine hydroxylase n=1 Tax=Cyphomyrmex costatus TaxID=456900 RepID=A0A195CML7_9HYME|nr:PREDICTED: deoxyhypusine hydroxylase [Cyphomyrmex costatus]KYN01935.1 Deoxyhypusine hydroxylase [Cyphomyrmex costatus]